MKKVINAVGAAFKAALADMKIVLEDMKQEAAAEAKERKEQAKRERANSEAQARQEQALEYIKRIERTYGGSIQQAIANALNAANIHADLQRISPFVMKSSFIKLDGCEQHWVSSILVSPGAAYAIRKDSERIKETLENVFASVRNHAIKKFGEKVEILDNSKYTARERNLTWRQYYADNFYYLHKWQITTLNIFDNKLIINMVVTEMPEVQNFSPRRVFWQETPQQTAP